MPLCFGRARGVLVTATSYALFALGGLAPHPAAAPPPKRGERWFFPAAEIPLTWVTCFAEPACARMTQAGDGLNRGQRQETNQAIRICFGAAGFRGAEQSPERSAENRAAQSCAGRDLSKALSGDAPAQTQSGGHCRGFASHAAPNDGSGLRTSHGGFHARNLRRHSQCLPRLRTSQSRRQ